MRRRKIAANAFREEFLSTLDLRDEPDGAREAELDGPWRVEPLRAGTFGLFRSWQRPEFDRPYAAFARREHALLLSVVLPALGREPYFQISDPRATPSSDPNEPPPPFPMGLSVVDGDRGPTLVGEVGEWYPELREALQIGVYLARHPEALATLLDAAGPRAVAAVGEILDRRHRAEAKKS